MDEPTGRELSKTIREMLREKEGRDWLEQKTCKEKRTYPNNHRAKIAARIMSTRWGDKLTVYKCPFCRKYHLTKAKRRP